MCAFESACFCSYGVLFLSNSVCVCTRACVYFTCLASPHTHTHTCAHTHSLGSEFLPLVSRREVKEFMWLLNTTFHFSHCVPPLLPPPSTRLPRVAPAGIPNSAELGEKTKNKTRKQNPSVSRSAASAPVWVCLGFVDSILHETLLMQFGRLFYFSSLVQFSTF